MTIEEIKIKMLGVALAFVVSFLISIISSKHVSIKDYKKSYYISNVIMYQMVALTSILGLSLFTTRLVGNIINSLLLIVLVLSPVIIPLFKEKSKRTIIEVTVILVIMLLVGATTVFQDNSYSMISSVPYIILFSLNTFLIAMLKKDRNVSIQRINILPGIEEEIPDEILKSDIVDVIKRNRKYYTVFYANDLARRVESIDIKKDYVKSIDILRDNTEEKVLRL